MTWNARHASKPSIPQVSKNTQMAAQRPSASGEYGGRVTDTCVRTCYRLLIFMASEKTIHNLYICFSFLEKKHELEKKVVGKKLLLIYIYVDLFV